MSTSDDLVEIWWETSFTFEVGPCG